MCPGCVLVLVVHEFVVIGPIAAFIDLVVSHAQVLDAQDSRNETPARTMLLEGFDHHGRMLLQSLPVCIAFFSGCAFSGSAFSRWPVSPKELISFALLHTDC